MKKHALPGYAALVAISLLTVLPLFFLMSTSLKTYAETQEIPPALLPRHFNWQNYADIFHQFPFARYLFNTVIIAAGQVGGILVSSAVVAWGFARYPGRWNSLIFAILMATLMLPRQITIIPIFAAWVHLGFYNTYVPLIFPAWLGFNAFNIFLMKQFFQKIPKDLLDAARIDGATEWQIFYKIGLPLCMPIISTLTVLNLIASWNDYFAPLIYLNDESRYPISLGLTYFKAASADAAFGAQWQLMMAATLVTILPVVVVFFFAQRTFINSVMSSALKE